MKSFARDCALPSYGKVLAKSPKRRRQGGKDGTANSTDVNCRITYDYHSPIEHSEKVGRLHLPALTSEQVTSTPIQLEVWNNLRIQRFSTTCVLHYPA